MRAHFPFTFANILSLDEKRHQEISENLYKLCIQYNGGIVAILGSGHYPVQNILLEKRHPRHFQYISYQLNESSGICYNSSLFKDSVETIPVDTMSQVEINNKFKEVLQSNLLVSDQFSQSDIKDLNRIRFSK